MSEEYPAGIDVMAP